MLCPWVLSEFSPSLLVPAAALSHGQKGQQAPSPPPVPATLHFTEFGSNFRGHTLGQRLLIGY